MTAWAEVASRAAQLAVAEWSPPEEDQDWEPWLRSLFPGEASHPFGVHHQQFWAWVWSIEKGVRPDPFVAVWPRGGAKSSSAEMAVAALGARRVRRYGLYICHEVGTPIFDPSRPEDGWISVEKHVTAQVVEREGLTLSVAGLPAVTASETVTGEHRYWARRVATRQVKGVGQQTVFGAPHWIEAQHLDWNTWIGLPVDDTPPAAPPVLATWSRSGQKFMDDPFPLFDDPEFWWMVGLWWGDGTLGAERGAAITFACGDAHPDIRDRLVSALRGWGYHVAVDRGHNGALLSNVRFCDSVLARWLRTWKHGNSRKEPPLWVEQLDAARQVALLRGYLDADGHCDERGAQLSSIHLPGLLAVRRMLARLGVTCTIGSVRSPGTVTFPGGRPYVTQRAYVLRIEHGKVLGLPETQRSRRHDLAAVFIRDGFLWSRVRDVVPAGVRSFVPIQTATEDYLTAFGLSHNCATQDQADDHVSNVAGLLESDRLAGRYPDMATRMLGKYGASKGWRRNRLRTASGFSIDAMGLDTAARGIKLEDARPDFMVIDDIDKETDSPAATERKIKTLTRGVFPAGSADCAILAIQNLVHENSVFAHLVDGRADFLASRTVSGPVKALDGMAHEQIGGRTIIVAGDPTWVGQDRARCQEQVDDWGISAFLGEAQHDVTAPPGGMFDHLSFAHCRPENVPELVRTVVWVDPAVTDKDTSDAHGIQADGIASDGTIYRLRSWEQRTSPRDALRRAILMAIEVGADHVGVETDQGGDTWTSVYREAAQDVIDERLDEGMMEAAIPPFTSDKAGAGYGPKTHRAGQMLADYERTNRTGGPAIVHVLGTHEVLEAALRRFPKTKPYDLVDTAFWGWNDLRRRRRGLIQSDYTDLRGRR